MKGLSFLIEFVSQNRRILAIYIIISILITLQMISLGESQQFNNSSNDFYTSYNNYIIFKQSWFHLVNGSDLFIHYPSEYFDLYKYSPTFALAMGLLAYLPDYLGLMLWNMLNVTVLYFAIRTLPFSRKNTSMLLLFVLVELVTATQNSQSNALLAGLLIAAFGQMNKGKVQWAALLMVFATFIKVYGAVGFCLFLLYPGKLKFMAYAALWAIIMLLAPLLVTSPQILISQYISWGDMMATDQAVSHGLSVMGWLNKWFGLTEAKTVVTLAGILLFFLPFTRLKMYKNTLFRQLVLAFMLIWVIIFNHKAESATFIIAMCGIGIWYFARPATTARTLLLWSAFVLVSLGSTELSGPLRNAFFDRYAIKPFACIVIWVLILMQLMTMDRSYNGLNVNTQGTVNK